MIRNHPEKNYGSSMKAAAQSLAEFLAGLAAEPRALTDRLRAVIAAAAPGLSEHIKWNAPSFRSGDDDRITLNYGPKGAIRIILHRGAKPQAGAFAFDDPDALAAWPAPDRGVVTIRDGADLDARRDSLARLIARWIAATG